MANPGCYATAAVLALAPIVAAGLVEPDLVVDGKSGVSGAGKTPTERNSFCAAAEGIAPYQPVGHHHQLEIEAQLSELAGGPVSVTFTPHLAPFTRGLLVTAYAPAATGRGPGRGGRRRCSSAYQRRAVRAAGRTACARRRCAAATSASCRPGSTPSGARVIVAAAIDNLVKGAAGQAVQNANLMLGLDETLGLPAEPAWL